MSKMVERVALAMWNNPEMAPQAAVYIARLANAGLVIVPREPTPAMTQAGVSALSHSDDTDAYAYAVEIDAITDVWIAMNAAALADKET